MIRSIGEVLKSARDDRVRRLPVWAQILVDNLAVHLDRQTRYAEATARRAELETDAARKLLNEGPENSDTFLSLAGVLSTGYSEDENDDRPLGSGVRIEFRLPGDGPGEGFEVRLKDGSLEISGLNVLAVAPVDSHTLKIFRN
jgi:hypothetical protein